MEGVRFSLPVDSSPMSATIMLQNDDDASVFAAFLRNTPLPHRFRMITYTRTPSRNCIVYYERVDLTASHDPDASIVYGKDGLPYRRVCRDDSERIYPINRLRNLAIQNTLTTHFLVLDMDMWPVSTTYTDLITLPRNILQNEHLALILPAFSLKKKAVKKCRSFQECVETAAPLLPNTKRELQACVEKEECSTFRPESFTHVGLLCRADE